MKYKIPTSWFELKSAFGYNAQPSTPEKTTQQEPPRQYVAPSEKDMERHRRYLGQNPGASDFWRRDR